MGNEGSSSANRNGRTVLPLLALHLRMSSPSDTHGSTQILGSPTTPTMRRRRGTFSRRVSGSESGGSVISSSREVDYFSPRGSSYNPMESLT